MAGQCIAYEARRFITDLTTSALPFPGILEILCARRVEHEVLC